jgi:hypothetical protein
MKYFLHDSNAFSDEKVTLLYLKFGYEAVGLFFTILEKLALQEQPVNEIVLKSQLNIKKRLTKQLSFMYEIGILSLRNGDVFSENILKFSEKYQIKKEKTRKRVSEWRNNQDSTKNVTSYKRVRNTPKDKISKDKINKESINTLPTNEFVRERELLRNVYKLFDFEIIDCLTEIQKEKWLDTINKLNRIDKYEYSEIQNTIIWGRNDEFWKSNFHSILGLRKKTNGISKFFQINKKMNYERNGKNGNSDKQIEDLRKIAERIANDPDLI